jgi:hypothetical protein
VLGVRRDSIDGVGGDVTDESYVVHSMTPSDSVVARFGPTA